jgi:hypothetical protein
LSVVDGGTKGPGKPDANVRFVGTKGGAEMLGKDVGTCQNLVNGVNNDEVGKAAVMAGP